MSDRQITCPTCGGAGVVAPGDAIELRECERCGAVFIRRGDRKRFCSRDCQVKALRR